MQKEGDILPSILTIKEKEAKEACEKLEKAFENLKAQMETTHNEGFKNLKSKVDNNENLINYQNNTFDNLKLNTDTLNTKQGNILEKAKKMNNLET
jgi:ElaB/YqjD/DUF883 family membrane-anchored ribosome-binding protein